jgi:hypothetical protein
VHFSLWIKAVTSRNRRKKLLVSYILNPVGKLLICAPGLDFASYKVKLDAVEIRRKSVLAKLTR